jgi:hypothetical protein
MVPSVMQEVSACGDVDAVILKTKVFRAVTASVLQNCCSLDIVSRLCGVALP